MVRPLTAAPSWSRAVRHTGRGITNVGTLKGPYANAEKVADALRQAGFEAAAHENVMQLIWHKLFANIAINAITALLDQTNATVAENPYEHTLAGEHGPRGCRCR